jgi:hypothetical protein
MLLLLLITAATGLDLHVDLVSRQAKGTLLPYLTDLRAFLEREQRVSPQGKPDLMLRLIALHGEAPRPEILPRLQQLMRSHATEARRIVERFLREDADMPLTLPALALFHIVEDESLFQYLMPVEVRRLKRLVAEYEAVREWGEEKRRRMASVVERVKEAVAVRVAMARFERQPAEGEALTRVERLSGNPALHNAVKKCQASRSALEKAQLLKEIGVMWRLEVNTNK